VERIEYHVFVSRAEESLVKEYLHSLKTNDGFDPNGVAAGIFSGNFKFGPY
jgi:hypothetical protein